MFKGIFVHIPKVAGTSIAKAFEPFQEEVVITESTNFFKHTKARLDLTPLFNFDISSTMLTKHLVGDYIWNNTFKFAFVRNPWDRYVSNWKWLTRKEKLYPTKGWKARGWRGEDGTITFEDFVNQVEKIYLWRPMGYQHDKWHLGNQVEHLKGEAPLDFIGKYENLKEDFKHVCDKLETSVELPYLNHVGFYEDEPQTTQPHYSTYYTDETAEIVRQRCLPDIMTFNYEFEWRK